MTSDHQLKQDVLAELKWEPSISADHIGVTAQNGMVTLSGHGATYWQKQAAETAAGRVKGCKALAAATAWAAQGTMSVSNDILVD